jgi:hypothetical protein
VPITITTNVENLGFLIFTQRRTALALPEPAHRSIVWQVRPGFGAFFSLGLRAAKQAQAN